MNSCPLVSVIIPSYNSEEWIVKTLNSVFAQTYNNLEVLIIDDGSTDGTKEVLSPYLKKGEVEYYFQTNQGPAAARNLGIEKAEGKYIAFLDSDDLWIEEKIEKQVRFLENNAQYKFVLSNAKVIDERGTLLYTNINKAARNEEELIINLFLGQIIMNTPTILAEKNAVRAIGGFDESLIYKEDHLFLIKAASNFKVKQINEALIKRRLRAGSMRKLDDPEQLFKIYKKFMQKSIEQVPFLEKYKSHMLAKVNRDVAKRYFKQQKRVKALKFIVESIRIDPSALENYLIIPLLCLPLSYSFWNNLKQDCSTLLRGIRR